MSFNPYDSGGPIDVVEPSPGSRSGDGIVEKIQDMLPDESGDSDITTDTVFDFENKSAQEISDYAMKHNDWYKQNASLVDYWLNEKSYYGREDTKIARYMKQLQESGINPILAYQYAGNASASGGASSDSADYFASLTSSKRNYQATQESNVGKIIGSVLALIGTMIFAAAVA